ncbi:MAG TPA: type II toxin-antitoxin system PemK/MazF family toxin [Steroidobacteraceae bacterium]
MTARLPAAEVRHAASAKPARRGEFVTVVLSGDFGKPRPALIIQADHFAAVPTVTLLLVTSTLSDTPLLRVNIHPDGASGLRKPSQVMIDKTMTVKRERVGSPIGRIDADTLVEIERRLAVFLGIAK